MTSELLSPAGDFETARAAFAAGADAVYCGLSDFSARAFAVNFSFEDLNDLVRYAHAKEKKVYVTFNTLLDECQMDGAIETLSRLAEIAPDAIIVQDLGIAALCHKHFPELKLHASTQMVAHNLEGVLALGEIGFTRVVLARELSLEEIASIRKRCGQIELEVFIHGALCYSLSGLCLFGAMEKGRSGNRGKCPYCCRLPYEDNLGRRTLAFSMKDLRLGEDVRKLVDIGVASLKIEGRMKSALYVASVTKYYRQILGEGKGKGEKVNSRDVTVADLETVFSRRTTELYLNDAKREARSTQHGSPIDATSLGHLGTPIGKLKRVTRDREGQRWLRFHTSRALEKHDGLQFANPDGGKPNGFGIGEMRQAISRAGVFEVEAGTDVEVALPELPEGEDWTRQLKPGDTVYCSMSNAVKRMFPIPSFRESDYPGMRILDVELKIEREKISVVGRVGRGERVEAEIKGTFEAAKNSEKTREAVERAFAKLGGTDYSLGRLVLEDTERLFVPASILNDLRRDLVEKLDTASAQARSACLEKIRGEAYEGLSCVEGEKERKVVKVRVGQSIPPGEWDEVVIAINAETTEEQILTCGARCTVYDARLSLPVYNAELTFNKLRTAVKRLVRAGFAKWEASDLATLRLLKEIGVTDITADWTLYAFNARALALLTDLGVRRVVASPENNRDNLQYLAESGYDVEFLVQQSTPRFISLTKPMDQTKIPVFERDGLFVTTNRVPRTFTSPSGVSTRVDLSWDAP